MRWIAEYQAMYVSGLLAMVYEIASTNSAVKTNQIKFLIHFFFIIKNVLRQKRGAIYRIHGRINSEAFLCGFKQEASCCNRTMFGPWMHILHARRRYWCQFTLSGAHDLALQFTRF